MDIGALIENKYQVIEHIGRGGMADVWSARDQRLRRMVAIKTIAAGLTQDMDPLALFEKEAQTIAGMEHPHILPIYSFGAYEGSLYIAMRYVTGGSLEDRLENGAMDADEILRIGGAVAGALDHAHENNIIHLDLKPGNILLDSHNAPYLADFGLATVLDPEGRAKNPGSGTLLYMAPEQLVSDMIDYRADIYSFCIMLFHMFTGQLPFEGTVPLAMKQLQSGQNLPDVTDINPDLHDGLTEILRFGTAQDAKLRPDTHTDIIEQLHDLFTPVTVGGFTDIGMSETETGTDLAAITEEQERLAQYQDADLLEAVDIYTRARQAWAGGHGRFLLGLTHFMLMSDYYMEADFYKLSIDETGYQMLLRGALEYDYELDYWWEHLQNQEAQRRVALHTLRSGTAPARIRSLKRLEFLPDDEIDPVIPRLVSQAMEVESDDDAKIAALNVLRVRAEALKRYSFDKQIKPIEKTALDSVAHSIGIQLAPPSDWQEVIYSDEVDELIAETALTATSERVSDFAARTIGQIHSLTGVRYIANAAHEKQRGALEALALIRDETTSLPDEVDRQAKLYAWLMNTLRRLVDRPLEGILRFVLVLLGAWIGMGETIYVTFNSQTLFTPQRWMFTISFGIVFGLFVSITLMVADEFSRRLAGFWRWWLRLLVSGTLALFMSLMTWAAITWLFLHFVPEWNAVRLAGSGLAFALVVAAMLDLKTWRAVLFAAPIAWLPIFVLFHTYYFPDLFVASPAPLIALLLGGFVGWLAARRSGIRTEFELVKSPYAKIGVAVLSGAALVIFIWYGMYLWVMQGFASGIYLTWDGILATMILLTVLATIVTYYLRPIGRIAFLLTIAATFTAFLVSAGAGLYFQAEISRAVRLANFAPAIIFDETVTLLYIINPAANWHMVYTVFLPMVFIVMLGAYGRDILRDWWNFIGPSFKHGERGGWLTGMLAYALPVTALVSLLSTFNMHVDIPWAIGWSLWGFLAFIFALATWRRALWGARGMIVMSVLLIAGGFLYDLRDMVLTAQSGNFPAILADATILLHPGNIEDTGPLLSLLLQTPLLVAVGLLALLFAIRTMMQNTMRGLPVLFAVLTVMGASLFIHNPLQITIPTLAFWAMWAVVMAVLAVLAYRRVAWASIGLIFMGAGWFLLALFTPVQESMAILALTHAAVLVYAIQPAWAIMEPGRFRLPIGLRSIQPVDLATDTADTEQTAGEPIAPITLELPQEESDRIAASLDTAAITEEILEDSDMMSVIPNPIGDETEIRVPPAETGMVDPMQEETAAKINFDGNSLEFPSDRLSSETEVDVNMGQVEPEDTAIKPRIRLDTAKTSDQSDEQKPTRPRIRLDNDDMHITNKDTQAAPLRIKLDASTSVDPTIDKDASEEKSPSRMKLDLDSISSDQDAIQTQPRIKFSMADMDGEEQKPDKDTTSGNGSRIKLDLDSISGNDEAPNETPTKSGSRIKLDLDSISGSDDTSGETPTRSGSRIKLDLDSISGTDDTSDEAPSKSGSRIKLDLDSISGSDEAQTKPRLKLNLDAGDVTQRKSQLRIKLDDDAKDDPDSPGEEE